mmetsp:Transcript_90084/g.263380  ORF Transcript_90084/g.263380 Transcript_90084/m.263380 type:complete len:204 (-) Transcript_90084:24-635(-)
MSPSMSVRSSLCLVPVTLPCTSPPLKTMKVGSSFTECSENRGFKAFPVWPGIKLTLRIWMLSLKSFAICPIMGSTSMQGPQKGEENMATTTSPESLAWKSSMVEMPMRSSSPTGGADAPAPHAVRRRRRPHGAAGAETKAGGAAFPLLDLVVWSNAPAVKNAHATAARRVMRSRLSGRVLFPMHSEDAIWRLGRKAPSWRLIS